MFKISSLTTRLLIFCSIRHHWPNQMIIRESTTSLASHRYIIPSVCDVGLGTGTTFFPNQSSIFSVPRGSVGQTPGITYSSVNGFSQKTKHLTRNITRNTSQSMVQKLVAGLSSLTKCLEGPSTIHQKRRQEQHVWQLMRHTSHRGAAVEVPSVAGRKSGKSQQLVLTVRT